MKRRDCRAKYARNDTAPPPRLPRQGGGYKRGFTLIEVILAIVVITIAVSATLVTMSKMMNYTVNRGQAVDISNAITISQMEIDRVRDQKFPPTESVGDLSNRIDIPVTVSDINYTYTTKLITANGTNIPTQYDASGDAILIPSDNLLQVTVTVSKNGRPLLTTMTYKTRNGYY